MTGEVKQAKTGQQANKAFAHMNVKFSAVKGLVEGPSFFE
jgi:hypothetical protein